MSEMLELTWQDVFERVHKLPAVKRYGIPRGGSIVSVLARNCVDTPEEADYFVDDIIDSGRTRDKWEKQYDKKVHALVDKQKENLMTTWIVFPWEKNTSDAEDHITRIIEMIGDDPTREGLLKTPERVVKSWKELYSGYGMNPDDIITTFDPETYDNLIMLKDIEFYSTCEHHLMPFYGKAHIAYIPNQKIIGISKLARLLEIYSRRLQIQERIGELVTTYLMNKLNAVGAACIIEAKHLCISARGVQKQGSKMVTSSLKGAFLEDGSSRQELMSMIR
jgi:GTP cyclohydrolase I